MESTYGYEPDELLRHHIKEAEHHARAAHDLLYKSSGPKRGVFFKMAIGRAQSILMSLHVREVTEHTREEREREQRSTEHGRDIQG